MSLSPKFMINVIDDTARFYDFIGKFTVDIHYIQFKKNNKPKSKFYNVGCYRSGTKYNMM